MNIFSIYRDKILIGLVIAAVLFIGYKYSELKLTIADRDITIATMIADNSKRLAKEAAEQSRLKVKEDKLITSKEIFIDAANKDIDQILDEAIDKVNGLIYLGDIGSDENSTIGILIANEKSRVMDSINIKDANKKRASIKKSHVNITSLHRAYRLINRRINR